MARFSLRIGESAKREFEALPHPFRRHINRRIYFLRDDPFPPASEPLGAGRRRLYLYGYWLLYEVEASDSVIAVVAIDKVPDGD